LTAVSASWWFNGIGLEETLLGKPTEIIKPKRTEENEMKIEAMERSKTNANYTTPHKIVSSPRKN